MEKYTIHHADYEKDATKYISSKGAFLINENGSSIFDAGLGAGSQILGHCHDDVIHSLKEQAERGMLFLKNNPQIHLLAEQLSCVLPHELKNFVFCNSGSEATQRAIRYARAATSKNKIASFHGGWHGMNEWTLQDDGGRFGGQDIRLPSGIPLSILEHSILLPYNDQLAFDILSQNKNQLAAICIEPIQGSNPRGDIISFLKKIEAFCKDNGILVIYDEIITGFRLGIGGACTKWKLNPDIVTYGKILGGGLPVGLVAFTDEVSQLTFKNKEKRILSGGTFSANPLMATTACAVINCLKHRDYSLIDNLASTLREQTNKKLTELGIPCRLSGEASINRLYFTDIPIQNRAHRDQVELDTTIQQRFRENMMKLNVLWPTNGIIFTGFCHNKEMITEFGSKIVSALQITLE
ncbi:MULTISPECIES: aminotransferase class III-fold pyridoxal phosphate-dependent enzyme [Aeromonas]|uniref:aminotransferase class III-fold pyridoxal phosphate-dependent enzyme n=1 Tax=Aeromonas TaxID=642 RepID=UPI0002EEC1AE|nr:MULTISPECIES: aminotransferase class III-fold pyridoxal phosphate-dependent enzyme [Aeromonas]MCF5853280.1 aminotransferase class III-fold pyridoxal phosphate-dependent enzyme [Aeromonas veronii]